MTKLSLVSPKTHNVMVANRGRDTKPELQLRRSIHRRGLRYSIDSRPEPDLNRRADLIFRSARLAVFVNGCFWHGCPIHFATPKANRNFWSKKIARNRQRDEETIRLLKRRGWRVIVVWEHQDLEVSAKRISLIVKRRRTANV